MSFGIFLFFEMFHKNNIQSVRIRYHLNLILHFLFATITHHNVIVCNDKYFVTDASKAFFSVITDTLLMLLTYFSKSAKTTCECLMPNSSPSLPPPLPSWNRRGSWKILQNLINGGAGINQNLENSWKFYSWGGVEKIFFDTTKQNTKKLKRFGFLSSFKKSKFMDQMHSFRH